MSTPAVPSLAHRVMRAGGWAIGGNVANQAIRFCSNLLMTRLLYPEAFGLMAIVQSVLVAAALLSDIGLKQSVVLNPRGEERDFLNTVWTLQAIKGVVLAGMLVLISPALATAFGQPQLAYMLPVMGLTALISGFESPRSALAGRRLQVRRLVQMELTAQLIGVAVMICWAVWSPSVWALVAGNLASGLMSVVQSHLMLPGPRQSFAWERRTVREVVHFGGWVLVSSAITYFAGEGRHLLVASLVDIRSLGLLSIAGTLSLVVWNAIQQLGQRVLFPAYAEVWRDRPHDLPRIVSRTRLIQLVGGGSVSLLLALLGDQVVRLLYDARYAPAGAYLQIMAAGSLFAFLPASFTGVLWAMGRPGLSAALMAGQALCFFGLTLLGHSMLGGVLGVVTGGALTGLFMCVPTYLVYRRLGLVDWRLDLPAFAIASIAAASAFQFGAWRTLVHTT